MKILTDRTAKRLTKELMRAETFKDIQFHLVFKKFIRLILPTLIKPTTPPSIRIKNKEYFFDLCSLDEGNVRIARFNPKNKPDYVTVYVEVKNREHILVRVGRENRETFRDFSFQMEKESWNLISSNRSYENFNK